MELTKPFAKYPHIRQVGDLYFLAGQGCRDPITDKCVGLTLDSSGSISSYDIAAQTRGVLQNIERALTSVGLTPADLVDVTVFLMSMKDFNAMNLVWNDFFADILTPPTRTTVAVSELPGDNYVEMKATAYRRSR